MYVDGAATHFGEGWYIDDIKIEREKSSPYIAYPFVDDAENATFTAQTGRRSAASGARPPKKAAHSEQRNRLFGQPADNL